MKTIELQHKEIRALKAQVEHMENPPGSQELVMV